MSTAKLFGGNGFVEGCLESQINASVCESNMGSIGPIGEAAEVVMPQLAVLADYFFLAYEFIVLAHEGVVSFHTLLESDYFCQYSIVTEFLQSAMSVSICETPLFQVFERGVVSKRGSL